MRISQATVAPVQPLQPEPAANGGPARELRFRDVLAEAIQRVESYRAEAHQAVQKFLSGESEELHEVALATQRAELAFELFLQVRNKLVQAYQDVMHMQV